MHTRTTAAITAALCTLLLAGCSSRPKPTYAELTDNCAKAIAARADGDKAKPKACEGVTQDDYDTLLMSHVIDQTGLTDKDGNIDPSKLLDPSATP